MSRVRPVEIYGEVVSVLSNTRGKTKRFKVQTSDGSFSVVRSPYFCPVWVGDAFYGLSKPADKGELELVRPPLVKVGEDEDSLITLFIKGIKSFGHTRATKLYHDLFDRIGAQDGHDLVEYLNDVFETGSRSKILDCVLKEQHYVQLKVAWLRRNRRQLHLLGLTNREIGSIRRYGWGTVDRPALTAIYRQALENPYVMAPLKIEKANEILGRFNSPLLKDPEEQLRAQIARYLYKVLNDDSWSSVPEEHLSSETMKPHWTQLHEVYGLQHELGGYYLPLPYRVECGLVKRLSQIGWISFWVGQRLIMPNEPIGPIKPTENLTEIQCKALELALSSSLSIINGPAGSGKTTIIRTLVEILGEAGLSYHLTSLTGKAVARLREVTRSHNATTIHSMIFRGVDPNFHYLIVDESSMVTSGLFYRLLQRYRHNFRLVMVGDTNQLEPIGWAALFEQLIKSQRFPIVTLDQVHRTEGQDITENTVKLLEPNQGRIDFEPNQRFHLEEGGKDDVMRIVGRLYQARVNPDQVTIITPYNRNLPELNVRCQQLCNIERRVGLTDGRNRRWIPGDRVMVNTNLYENKTGSIQFDMFNGDEGQVVWTGHDRIRVEFPHGDAHEFHLSHLTKAPPKKSQEDEDLDEEEKYGEALKKASSRCRKDEDPIVGPTTDHLDHAYAVTVHKSQGSEWDYVILFVPFVGDNQRAFLNRRLIYTALTRARKEFWFVGDIEGLSRCAAQPAPLRHDSLGQRLRADE